MDLPIVENNYKMKKEKMNKFLDRLAAIILIITFIAFMIMMSIIVGWGGPWYAYFIWPTLCTIITVIGWAFHRIF